MRKSSPRSRFFKFSTRKTHIKNRRLFLESLEQRQMLTSVPVALNDPLYSTSVNTNLTISTQSAGIVNNDFDADGNSLSASVVANPANGTLTSFNSNGTFTYSPDTDFSGIDTFTYTVSDGTNTSNVATVSIAVGGHFGPRTNLDEVPAGAMLLTGALSLAQPLTLGHQLVYRSDTVNPNPIISLETWLLSTSDVPDSIDARLTFNSVQEDTVSYDTGSLSAGDPLRFVLQADASSTATGYYDWSITLTAWFDSNSVTRTYTGSQAVVNRTSSEYGKGWWMDGLDQIVASGSNALLVRGNGDTLWFKGDGSGGYLKAPGDTSFSTLVKNVDNTFTLTDKYGLERNFGTTGLLTSVVDLNDNAVSYTYTDGDSDSTSDELWKITDPFTRVNTLSYSSTRVSSFQDLASRTTSLSYTSGQLTSVTMPDPDSGGALASPVHEYAYDATSLLLTTYEDPLNYDTTYAYDATSLRLDSITHPDSTDWELTPQLTIGLATGSGNSLTAPADAIGQYIDERSKTWQFQTDRFGNITFFKDPLNNVTTTERDANGLPIRLTEMDPDGGGSQTSPISKFGYNSSGDLVKQYLPDGNDLEWTYHSTHHRMLSFTNELNNTWEYTYDSDANLTAAEDPLGNTTSYQHNLRGQVTDVTTPDPDGAGSLTASTTEYAYDADTGVLETITNPGSSTRTFTYNTADQMLTLTDELSHVWSWAYDALGRLTSETTPDPDGAGSLTAATTSYTYDAASQRTKVTDALANETDYTFNNRGWVTQIQHPDPDGAGSLGRPTATFQYNAIGQVTQEGNWVFSGGGAIIREYDAAGRLTSEEGPITQVGMNYTYDNLGRVTRAALGSSGEQNYNYTDYAYNSRGWTTSETGKDPDGGGSQVAPVTSYTYDAAGQLLNTTNARGYVTTNTYDARGLLTKITQPDPDGSGGGLVSSITQFGYDNVGRQTTVTDALGRVTTTAYDSRNRVTSITAPDPDGAGGASAPVTSFGYDNANRRTSVTDPLSRVTSYAYDNANRLLTVTGADPDGGGSLTSPVTTYAYNKMNSVTSVTDALGNVTSTTFDTLQRVTQVTQPDPDGAGGASAPVTTYTYNAQGLVSAIDDPLGRDTTFGYDNYGRRTTVTNHEGKVTTTAYDNYDRVTSVTTPDPDGAGSVTASVTTYTYNHLSQVTAIDDPRGGDTAFIYDAVGNLTNLQDASGNDTSWTYDGMNRVTTETNELTKTRLFNYDPASNLVRKIDRLGRVTRYAYDGLDRLTTETWYDGTAPTASASTVTEGGPVNEVQRVGHVGAFSGTFTLTFSGQTTSAIAWNASAATVQSALEALSNIGAGDVAVVQTQSQGSTKEWQVTFQNALGGSNVAQITINTANLVWNPTAIQTTDTQGGTSSEVQTITLTGAEGGTFRLTFVSEQTGDLAYNAAAATVEAALDALSGIDNVAVTGNAGGPYTITFGGTQANTNVAQITADVTNLTSGSGVRTLTFAYDAASQLTSASDPAAEYDYTYDNLGRLTAEVQDIAGLTPDIEFAHTYSANSMRTSLASEIGGTADFKNDYTYDNLSRMTQVIQQDVSGGGNVVADKRIDFAYNALGQFTSLTRYQSTGTSNLVATSTYTYDTLNHLTDLDHKQDTTNLALYDYAYDFMDRITSMTHSVDGASTFSYDKESQVTAADHASPISDETFSYDATGNRTMSGYDTDPNNQTVSDGTHDYEYDDEGNRTKKTTISTGYYEAYEWDYRNRLTGVSFYDDFDTLLQSVDYAYDIFNRWLRRTYDADGPGETAATDTFFAYDGGSINPSLQFDGAASTDLTNRYLFNPHAVDQLLASEDVTSLSSAGNILWPLADHLGTIRDIADLNEGSGITSVTNHRFYDSFGVLKSESNNAVDLIFGYTGKVLDEVTGLQNNVERWLDAILAQWLSEDPSGFDAADPNLRRYVRNSALELVDPYGLEDTIGGAAVSGVKDGYNDWATDWKQNWYKKLWAKSLLGETVNEVSEGVQVLGHYIQNADKYDPKNIPKNLEKRADAAVEQANEFAESSTTEKVHTISKAATQEVLENVEELPEAILGGAAAKAGKKANKLLGVEKSGKEVLDQSTGVVYKRTNPETGEGYVGQAKSPERFDARQGEHDSKLGVQHDFEVLGRAKPGVKLDVLEEDMIRTHGGIQKEGGTLVNKRHQMSEERYRANGGTIANPQK